MKYLLLLYRKMKLRPSVCRYCPSCSHYAEEAVEVHGVIYGLFLALKRLIRCNQWFPGGYDPVPGRLKTNVSRETLMGE
ncbi:MAG: membrane protein insertion efficiency factor YidD [Candidatus Saganbacteria bacterium]|nr:membrane protein insertion efficiency factor YidD [Candidatus Saganbacteria bacterium]